MATQYRPRTINDSSSESEETCQAGDEYILEEYVAGDLNGAEGAIAYYKSSSPGTQYTWDLQTVGNINASYCDFADMKVINGTIFADETCTGADQNNEGIVFAGSGTSAISSQCGLRAGVMSFGF